MYKKIIYGPPGTGKTTRLLNILESELKNYDSREIAFVSFTNKGVDEGKNRAMERFNITDKSLPYFRTIHSLCFKDCGYTRDMVMDKNNYKEFSDKLGMKFTGYYTNEFQHNDDRYLFYDTLERNTPGSAEELLNDLDITRVNYVRHNLVKYKLVKNKVDFTDMLEQYLLKGDALPVKVAIIDEAQDLTGLQWRVINRAFAKVDKMYIAGDDDQAIYQWSGADVDYFLNLDGDKEVLDKSYRLPTEILDFSKKITKQISNRIKKDFHSVGTTGTISYYNSVDELKINTSESWLLLARNNFYLKEYTDLMGSIGLNHSYKGDKIAKQRDIDQILIFEKLRETRDALEGEEKLLLDRCLNEEVNLKMPWYYNFNWPEVKSNYYRAVFQHKQDITGAPNVHINTIHGSKGGEADNVVLLLDITRAVNKACETIPDSELRCLYVGATRARKNLHIIYPKGKYSYERFL